MPNGWAESAEADPWWREIVPELLAYDAVTEDPSGLLRLEVGATPNTVYVGQQVSLFATVSVDPSAMARMGRNTQYIPPDLAGFARVNEVFGAAQFPVASQGDLQHSFSFQHVYFPLDAGQWTIPTGRVVMGLDSRGQGGLDGGEVLVQVEPVPTANAPTGYRGAVGRYRIRAWLEPDVIRWGEQGLLRVEVLGVGDVKQIQPPAISNVWGGELTPWRDYSWVEVKEGVVGGVRVFEYAVIPLEAAEVVIDPIVFPYFDPYVGDFGVAATGELSLRVLPPQ